MNLYEWQAAFAAAYKERHPYPYDLPEFMPSVSGLGKCARQQWYRLRHLPEPAEPLEVQWQQDEGHDQEVIIWRVLRNMGYAITTQKRNLPFILDGAYGGHADNYATGNDLTERTYVEAKQMNYRRYSRVYLRGVQAGEPVIYAQLQATMHATGIRQAMLICIADSPTAVKSEVRQQMRYLKLTDSGYVHPLVYRELVPYNAEVGLSLERRGRGLYASAKASVLPRRELDPQAMEQPKRGEARAKHWQCMQAYCAFRDACIAAGPGGAIIEQHPVLRGMEP